MSLSSEDYSLLQIKYSSKVSLSSQYYNYDLSVIISTMVK